MDDRHAGQCRDRPPGGAPAFGDQRLDLQRRGRDVELSAASTSRASDLAAIPKRASANGLDSLEALIRAACPGEAEFAKELIIEFGSIDRVFAASPEAIGRVTGEGSVTPALLAAIPPVLLEIVRPRVEDRPLLNHVAAVEEYLRVAFGTLRVQQCRTLFLNAKNRLIRDELMAKGSLREARLYPRQVVRRALELDSTGIILAHNHVSGDPAPRKDDKAVTRSLVEVGHLLGIKVLDHLIITQDSCSSFRALGLL